MNLLHRFFNSIWYSGNRLGYAFLPVSIVFSWLVSRRRTAYLQGKKSAYHSPLPVIVVGNITVGGTGKTPVTIWLIEALQQQGYRPGVVSRGYGGSAPYYPYRVSESDQAGVVGDEPLMMQRRTNVPVVVDPNRARAVQHLVNQGEVDVIISDDGLQHYGLSRTVELVVVDGSRGFGNRQLLPVGPLRESLRRLQDVDAVIINGESQHVSLQALASGFPEKQFNMVIAPGDLEPLNTESAEILKNGLPESVYAVAGIGNPQRFFQTLQALGIAHQAVPFPDHHDYSELDLECVEQGFVITTEKDAVKLRRFQRLKGAYLPINAQLQAQLIDVIIARLEDFHSHHRHRY
jgi:tetraacyldisaccharide 4'-kinase